MADRHNKQPPILDGYDYLEGPDFEAERRVYDRLYRHHRRWLTDQLPLPQSGLEDLADKLVGGIPGFELYDPDDTSESVADWLVEGWIPEGEVTVLAGDGGVGKSTLVHQLLLAYGGGSPWLGMKVALDPHAPLYGEPDYYARGIVGLFAEDSELVVKRRTTQLLRALELRPYCLTDAILVGHWPTPLVNLATGKLTEYGEHLEGQNLIVIDCAAAFFGGNDLSRTEVRRFFQGLGELCANGATVVLVGHLSADGRIAGSTDWVNAARSAIVMQRDGDLATLELVKSNYAPTGAKLHVQYRDGAFFPADPPATAGTVASRTVRPARRFSQEPMPEGTPTPLDLLRARSGSVQ